MQGVVSGNSAGGDRSDHRVSVGTLEVSLYYLIVSSITVNTKKCFRKKNSSVRAQCNKSPETKSFEFEALDSENINGLLALVGEPEVVGVPAQL